MLGWTPWPQGERPTRSPWLPLQAVRNDTQPPRNDNRPASGEDRAVCCWRSQRTDFEPALGRLPWLALLCLRSRFFRPRLAMMYLRMALSWVPVVRALSAIVSRAG